MPAVVRDAQGKIIQVVGHPSLKPRHLVRRFIRALARWIRAGCPLLTGPSYAARQSTCQTCRHWRPNGYLGLGKCASCGCSSLKLRLPTETCVKWRQIFPTGKRS